MTSWPRYADGALVAKSLRSKWIAMDSYMGMSENG